MKTLKAFWHWVDNEGHADWALALEKMLQNLSWDAQEALELAAKSVARRLRVSDDEPLACLDVVDHRGALRELSLAFCAALEAMHEQVAAPTFEQKRAHIEEWVRRMYAKPDRVLEAFDKGEALLVPTPEFAEAMVDDQIVPMHPETYALLAEAVSSAPVHARKVPYTPRSANEQMLAMFAEDNDRIAKRAMQPVEALRSLAPDRAPHAGDVIRPEDYAKAIADANDAG